MVLDNWSARELSGYASVSAVADDHDDYWESVAPGASSARPDPDAPPDTAPPEDPDDPDDLALMLLMSELGAAVVEES